MQVTFPAGTKIKNVRTGKYEVLQESHTVNANYRGDDDTWIWVRGSDLYEVKLHPGD
jgi:hypothetical protein